MIQSVELNGLRTIGRAKYVACGRAGTHLCPLNSDCTTAVEVTDYDITWISQFALF